MRRSYPIGGGHGCRLPVLLAAVGVLTASSPHGGPRDPDLLIAYSHLMLLPLASEPMVAPTDRDLVPSERREENMRARTDRRALVQVDSL